MATTVTAPLERQFGQMQGLSQMTSTSSGGVSVIVLQFDLSLSNIDIAEGRGAVGDQRRAELLPVRSARAAGLQQDESRGCADLTLAITSNAHAAFAGGRPGGYAACAEAFAAERRGLGEHQRRAEAGSAHSGESRCSFRPTA